jgi:hypothetical protein
MDRSLPLGSTGVALVFAFLLLAGSTCLGSSVLQDDIQDVLDGLTEDAPVPRPRPRSQPPAARRPTPTLIPVPGRPVRFAARALGPQAAGDRGPDSGSGPESHATPRSAESARPDPVPRCPQPAARIKSRGTCCTP